MNAQEQKPPRYTPPRSAQLNSRFWRAFTKGLWSTGKGLFFIICIVLGFISLWLNR